MTKAQKTLARYRSPASSRLLAHLLEQPELVTLVRQLPPAALGRLIDTIGLEASGELVALATTEQLQGVFDADLWRAEAPAANEQFDATRFALWLEVLLEAGEAALVERLCELPLDLITLAVHRLVLVIDIDAWALTLSEVGEDADLTEKALDSCLYEEWEEYRLMSRDASSWDAILTALLALDREHHDLLRRILERCAAMSAETIDERGGLYEVLTSDEMLESDTRAERDDRRASAGYVTPADARAFLALARDGLTYPAGADPLTRAYFRDLADATARPRETHATAATAAEASTSVTELVRLVGQVDSEPPSENIRALDSGANSLTVSTASGFDAALAGLREHHPTTYARRLEELSYLANVLVQGYADGGRRLRPVEATEAAIAVANLGLTELLPLVRGPSDSETLTLCGEILLRVPADRLFRLAWPRVHDRPELWRRFGATG